MAKAFKGILSKATNMAPDIDKQKCDKHGSENVFFCKGHDQVGCGRCLMKEHAACGPDIIDLDDITKEKVDTQLAKHIKGCMDNLGDDLLQIEINLSEGQAHNKTSKEDCLKKLIAYKNQIEDRIEKQTKLAKDAVTYKYKKIDEDIQRVSTMYAELKHQIVSKKNDFEASIRNNQYKKQYILMTSLERELESLKTEVRETRELSVTEPISLVCNTDLERWIGDDGPDFIVRTADDLHDATQKPPPLPPRPRTIDPTIECSSDVDDTPDCGEMREDDFVSSVRMGQGYFGEVFKGECKPLNATVVVKVYKDMCTDIMRQKISKQMAKLRTLEHPNLVKYIGIVLESQPIRIVMEYVSGQCLLEYLRSTNNTQTTKQALQMCVDIASGMDYLIAHGCLHTLLAARNCFRTETSVVKISDYGISDPEIGFTEDLIPFPIKWSAPEVFRHEQPTAKSDVWCYGVVMWEIFSKGDQPHSERSNAQTMDFVMNRQVLSASKGTPDSIYHLMKRCWVFFAVNRITFPQILEQIAILIKHPPSTENWN